MAYLSVHKWEKAMKRTIVILTLCDFAAAPLSAQALLGADPGRPTDLIAADLNLPEAAFVACFMDVNPAQSHAPSGARQHANKTVLLPCLQSANADITNDALDKVMERYRPEGPIHR
jgi:hypothetical protein